MRMKNKKTSDLSAELDTLNDELLNAECKVIPWICCMDKAVERLSLARRWPWNQNRWYKNVPNVYVMQLRWVL